MLNLSRASKINHTQNSEFLEKLNERRSSQVSGKDPFNASKHMSSDNDSNSVSLQPPKVRLPPRHRSSNNLLDTTNDIPVSTFK